MYVRARFLEIGRYNRVQRSNVYSSVMSNCLYLIHAFFSHSILVENLLQIQLIVDSWHHDCIIWGQYVLENEAKIGGTYIL